MERRKMHFAIKFFPAVTLVILLFSCIQERSEAFRLPRWTQNHWKLKSLSLHVTPKVGDVVVAEVDDFVGTMKDPAVSFAIRENGETWKAKMSTKSLSSAERMALQLGAVLQVKVDSVGDDGICVQMDTSSSGGSAAMGAKMSHFEDASFTPMANNEGKSFRKSKHRAVTGNKLTSSTPGTERPPAPGPLLNNLKTGMKLEGIVATSTPYAAFVNAGVYRVAKGKSYSEVNAMLHKSDIPSKLLQPLKGGGKQSSKKGGTGSKQLLEKGTPLTVYVKEIFKQSGRFTVTMDETIEKDKLIERKERTKQEGNERRRSRRLRRQLESVVAGKTVSGVVHKIINDGVLISVTSLGPLNVTGMIGKRDLPKQFELPPDLKESFQNQLLQQDFAIGREVICGVSKVHPNPSTSRVYNLKLQFEEFGAMPDDDLVIVDKFDGLSEEEKHAIVTQRKADLSEDDDYDYPARVSAPASAAAKEEEKEEDVDDDFEQAFIGDDAEYEAEVLEVFNELRGDSNNVLVQDLFAWDSLQDMMDDGSITEKDVQMAVRQAGASPRGTLTASQFLDVIEYVQDAMHEREGAPLDGAGEGDDDLTPYLEDAADLDQEDLLDNEEAATTTMTGQDETELHAVEVKLAAAAALKSAGTPVATALSDQEEADAALTAEEEERLAEESLMEVTLELYNELKGDAKTLRVDKFIAWEDVAELVDEGVLTEKTIQGLVKDVTATQDLTFDQFYTLIERIDEASLESQLEEEEEEEEEEGKVGNTAAAARPTVTLKESSSSAPSAVPATTTTTTTGVGGGGSSIPDDFEETEESFELLLQEIFDEMKGSDGKLSVTTFKAWDDVMDMIQSGLIQEDTLDALIAEVCIPATAEGLSSTASINSLSMTFEQFNELVSLLDDAAGMASDDFDEEEEEEEEEDSGSSGMRASIHPSSTGTGAQSPKDSGITASGDFVDVDLSEQLIESEEEVTKEVFQELCNDANKVPVKDFLAWDELQELIEAGLVDNDSLSMLIDEVGGAIGGELTFDQFSQLLRMIDETTAAIMGDEDFSAIDNDDGDNDEDDELFGIPSVSSIAATFIATPRAMPDPTINLEEEHGDYASDADEPTEEELLEMAKTVYEELKPKGAKGVPLDVFVNWESIQGEIDVGNLKQEEVEAVLKKIDAKNTGVLTLDQFMDAMEVLEEFIDELDDDSYASSTPNAEKIATSGYLDEGGDDGDDLSEEELREVAKETFEELKPKNSKLLPLKAFREWESVLEDIEEGNLTSDDVDAVLSKFGSTKGLTLEQFMEAMDKLEEIVELRLLDSDELLEVDDDDDDDVKNSSSPAITNKKPSPSAPAGTGFRRDAEAAAEAKKATKASKTTTGTPSEASRSNDAAIDDLTKEIFDDLRGSSPTLAVDHFRDWEELQEMVESNAIKRSSLEKVLSKTGVLESGQMTLQEFSQVLDLMQQSVDVSNLDLSVLDDDEEEDAEEEHASAGLRSSKNSQVLRLDDEDDDTATGKTSKADDEEEEEDDDEDLLLDDFEEQGSSNILTEEEAAQEIYNELCENTAAGGGGGGASGDVLTLGAFLQWEDVQELLDSGAISKDNLAKAIENCGVDVEAGNDSELPFSVFFDLLQIIDEYVNPELLTSAQEQSEVILEQKLMFDQKSDVEEVLNMMDNFEAEGTGSTDGLLESGPTRVTYQQADGEVLKGDAAVDAMEMALEQMEENDEMDEIHDNEILEMFAELSKGKKYITEKALRKWDELQELIEADLATQEVLDSYFNHIDMTDGKVDLPNFKKFMDMVDNVLVDAAGEYVGMDNLENAVDIDLDDDDDEEEEEEEEED